MLSSWGKSWGCSWGDSWGLCKTDGGGPGGSATKKKKRKKGQGWGLEREILERSLEKFREKDVESQPEIAPAPEKVYTVEEVGGLELIQEAKELQAAIVSKQRQLEQDLITQAEFEEATRKNREALEVISMALRLDKYVILQIIT